MVFKSTTKTAYSKNIIITNSDNKIKKFRIKYVTLEQELFYIIKNNNYYLCGKRKLENICLINWDNDGFVYGYKCVGGNNKRIEMTIKQIIIVLSISILTSCSRGYKIEGDKVYYESWNEGSGQNKRIIEQADAKTFKELNFNCDCNFEFGRDKNHLFINGELIKNIDPNTFKFIGNYIFRDKDSAYFFGFYNNLNDCAIKGVNLDKIELIKYPWAKAGNLLINGKEIVYLDDINDFIPLDDDWGKTKKYIINNNKILYGADVETFKITSSYQGMDKNFNYEFGIINEDDFKKTSLKNFDFSNNNFCQIEPIVFIDVYDSLVSYTEDKNKPIGIVEKLKHKGFSLNDLMYVNWGGESKIIRVSMTSSKCNCIVEKLYRYDFSKPYGTERIFKVTERIHCEREK